MLKCAGVVAVMLLSNLLCCGQSEEIERLNRVVQEQGQELEQLKAQLARIERALGMNAAAKVQPASYSPAPQATPAAPAQAAQTTLAGFRFSGDFRFRFDAAVRG